MKITRQVIQALRDLYHFQSFPFTVNAVRGRYASFDEALAAAPRGRSVGYDSERHAQMYDDRLGRLVIADYASLYWFAHVSDKVSTVLDLGGHVGVLYYAFRERTDLPQGLRWQVLDVPSTVERGRQLARERGADPLHFTTEWADGDGCDLLIASGVVQYLPWDLGDRIGQWQRKPRFILINHTPLYEGPDYITLQNTLLSFNPYRVFNQDAFLDSLRRHGYELRDSWATGRSLDVPFHPELRVESYRGAFLERTGGM